MEWRKLIMEDACVTHCLKMSNCQLALFEITHAKNKKNNKFSKKL